MKKTLHIIPHSHWDREWYLPFEKHRVRLVDLFDTLIKVMEENKDYTYYHMDGQYIVIEDYLEIKPEMRNRLFALIRAGRIQIGPWYQLQDEYLTSGEANVRNMLYGIKFCKSIGAKPVESGYFPDSFGNISQAPQIVRGFGFDNAIFGRGVNDMGSDNEVVKQNGVTKSELIWRAPDGSEVIGVMFANWYHNAMELPTDPEALKQRIRHIVASTSRFATTDQLLGMNGCDHQPIQTNLHEAIKLANEVQDEVEVKQSNFGIYVDEIRKHKDGLKVFEGEIAGQYGSGYGALINTASTHVDIKQLNHDGQHQLERISEPESVLAMLMGGKYKSELFIYAWRKLMQCHPHDSICTCSTDEVYDEMLTRFHKSRAVADQLGQDSLEYIASQIDTSKAGGDKAIVVLNLEPGLTATTVETYVDFEKDEKVQAIRVLDERGKEVPVTVRVVRNQFTYTLPDDRFRQPKYVDRFYVTFPLIRHGMGYTLYRVEKAETAPEYKTSIRYDWRSMENEFLKVCFNENGTFDLTDKRSGRVYKNQNLFERVQDKGNLYNFGAVEGDQPKYNECADISVCSVTPFSVTFRAKICVDYDADLTTYVTLTTGIARADIRTEIDNRGENQRIRALFDSGIDTKTVLAEGQFDLVRRNIQPFETWKNPCNTQRCQAFVALESENGKDALLVANRGLCEYEILRDGKNTVAVTLLRCTGEIGDWGVFPTPKGQCKGKFTLEYSVVPYCTCDVNAGYQLGYAFAGPAAVAIGQGIHEGPRPAADTFVEFSNPAIRITAFKKTESSQNHAVLRFFNTSSKAEELTIKLPHFHKAFRTNLNEDREEQLDLKRGKLTMTVPAKKIVTIELF
ncbi:MAG: alpha-mannosidase [Clostridia bacterium]|nr:alpha-mannosidase [Clostridia bacterium]